ncbi:MAG: DUF3380 domain-containing protein [Chloroflexi bacterium]|nr:DUF3380 domain-containing protein [Chloroflexota bacterium]
MALRGVVMAAQGLRLRSGAGTQYGVVTVLPDGMTVDVLERQSDWLRVRAGAAEGYAFGQYIRIVVDNAPVGFLGQQPDLLDIQLVSDKLIPVDGLTGAELVVAQTWNAYGNLLSRLSDLLAITVKAVVAVLVAESSGRAFAADGRMIIRFENHIFYRRWGEQHPDIFNRHFLFDTSSPRNNWKGHQWRPNPESPWVSFHGSQNREWDVLTFARALDDTAALSSISMGAPQIMGFNYKSIGYESVQHMFDQFARSAHAQLLAMFDVVKGPGATSPAIQALQGDDYLTFASAYNGPANALTYEGIIRARADIFDRLITRAVATAQPDRDTRGPVEMPAVAAVAPVVPTPPPVSALSVPEVVVTPPPPPEQPTVLVATVEALNVRREASPQAEVIERLQRNEAVMLLEPLDGALAKMAEGQAGGKFLNIRTDENREGYAAAWLLMPGDDSLVRRTVDDYINAIPDQFSIPGAYDQMRAAGDTIGLPDPFDTLPVQIRTRHRLVNMQVNGFGPNTFAARNWPRFYSRVGGMHNGYDFIIETGTPLAAVSDGVIIKNWPFMADPKDRSLVLWCFLPERFKDAQGRRMMSNVLVAYAHMSDNRVKNQFDVVKAGEVIGISGTPGGQGFNDHLHLEVHLLSGNTAFRNVRGLAPRKLLQPYSRPQPYSNQCPWNPIWFFSRRIIRYLLYQGKTIGYGGQPAYPPPATLQAMGAGHLPPLNEFTLAFFEYGIPVIWQNSGKAWPDGVATTDTLPDVIGQFEQFEPYEASFLD